MTSLATFLGVQLPKPGDAQPDASADVQEVLVDITDSKKFCQKILESREFRVYVLAGITLGTIPSAVILRLMDHGWGKPVDRIEVSDASAIENMTPELAVQKLERVERMLQLLRRAQIDDDDPGTASIH